MAIAYANQQYTVFSDQSTLDDVELLVSSPNRLDVFDAK